jgi:two-component system sensor histidine kinase RpfC
MTGALRRPLDRLRARLGNRADSEHEQALIRVAVLAVFFLYLLPEALDGGPDAWSLDKSLFLPLLGCMVLAAGIFAAIVISPGTSPVRRVFGAMVDSATASYFMARTGVNGLPLYVVYLWMIIGNGFRYGRFHLLNTLVLNSIGFSVVLYASPFWQANLAAGITMLLAMAALSAYVLSLVGRLNDALHHAEAANLAMRRRLDALAIREELRDGVAPDAPKDGAGV